MKPREDEGPRGRCTEGVALRTAASLLLILLYFSLSIGLTFYQRWLLRDVNFPLSIVLYHLVVKFCLAAGVRAAWNCHYGSPRVIIPFVTSLRNISPTGLASGIDVGFSNWALELVTVSLYTMTKSTTIIFILMFAIVLGLEKKSFSLVMIVVTISTGLTMFTYKATQFDMLGFVLLILASLASGLRWTFAQLLMQKSKLGLNNPIDLVYYVQPWMLLSVMPFAVTFEGLTLLNRLSTVNGDIFVPYFFKISFGAVLAFFMELSEYLVVTYTSSLTLSVAGIFKEVIVLVLAVKLTGDQLSEINVLGLCVCMLGICGHMAHKFWNASAQHHNTTIDYTPKLLEAYMIDDTPEKGKKHSTVFRKNKVHLVPLLNDDDSMEVSLDSDNESSQIIFDVKQRRDCRR